MVPGSSLTVQSSIRRLRPAALFLVSEGLHGVASTCKECSLQGGAELSGSPVLPRGPSRHGGTRTGCFVNVSLPSFQAGSCSN